MIRKSIVCLLLIPGLWLHPGASMSADADGNTPPTVDAKPPPSVRPPPGKTRDELFLEVFKRPPSNIPVSSYIVVVVDGVTQQKVKAVLSQAEQDLLVEGAPVVAFLSQSLRPDVVQRLKRKIDDRGWLDRAALEEAGLSTSFDRRKFEFSINTAPDKREKRIRYMSGSMTDPFTADAIRPAPVSTFLNFGLKSVDRREVAGSSTSHQSSVGLAADGAVNVMGVVLEGSAFGDSRASNSLQRGDVRLVYDQPKNAIRYSAGDLRYPVLGYQTIVNMGGIGFSKDFSLQPHVRSYRTGQFEFYLERPAEVKVWVNDSLVSTLQLPAGTHDIRGLALAAGQNDTRLVIEDNAGRREVLHFSFIHNPILLEKGKSLFSYNVGFHRELRDGDYDYDAKKPVLSASHMNGLTDETTLGAYTQAGLSRALFGAKGIQAFSVGTVQLDTATSRSEDAKWGVGTKLEWTATPDLRRGPATAVQAQASVEYLSERFGSIEVSSPAQGDALNLQASLAYPLGYETYGMLSGNYSHVRADGLVEGYRASATLVQRWGKYTTASVALRQRRSIQNEIQTELLFGISFSFAQGTSSFYAAKELETNTVAARWDSGRPSNLSVPYAFASTRRGPHVREYIGGAGYSGNQGLIEASQTRTETDQAALRSRDETTLRVQSALVAADGTFALARPVSQNFLIAKGQEGLAGVDMKVDPDGAGGGRAQSSLLSPAVLTDMESYRLREVRIEPVNPPLGATPEKTSFLLLPYYKSGFLLKLGKELRIVAVGRLVDEQRTPLAHLPIEIRRLDNGNEKPVSTFTSRGGGFQMPDIKPGRYEIRPPSTSRWGSVTVEIAPTKDDLYRLGDVVLPEK